MTKEEFIDRYFSKDVPEWHKLFVDNLNSVIKNEINKQKRKWKKAELKVKKQG